MKKIFLPLAASFLLSLPLFGEFRAEVSGGWNFWVNASTASSGLVMPGASSSLAGGLNGALKIGHQIPQSPLHFNLMAGAQGLLSYSFTTTSSFITLSQDVRLTGIPLQADIGLDIHGFQISAGGGIDFLSLSVSVFGFTVPLNFVAPIFHLSAGYAIKLGSIFSLSFGVMGHFIPPTPISLLGLSGSLEPVLLVSPYVGLIAKFDFPTGKK